MSRDHGTQGMAVSNYKADEKETARNKKKLMALVKQPGNIICADCPAKRKFLPLAPILIGTNNCEPTAGAFHATP